VDRIIEYVPGKYAIGIKNVTVRSRRRPLFIPPLNFAHVPRWRRARRWLYSRRSAPH
jgi:hypothetical protein